MSEYKDSFTCSLLPGKFILNQNVPELYNSIYQYWEKTWREIFTAAGSPESLSVENFLRQDVIVCLHQGNEIAGIITSSIFNLSADAIYDHPYIKAFPKNVIENLRAEGHGLILTGEYLSVHSGYRREKMGIALSDILIGLLMKVIEQAGARISLATTVRPARVHKIGAKFGWSELGNFTKYGLDCVLLQNSPAQARQHSDPAVVRFVNDCWSYRSDFTQISKIVAPEGEFPAKNNTFRIAA